MNMRYYKITKWKKICVKKKYNQCMRYIIAKTVKTIDTQQLSYKSALNNFVLNIQPNNCVDKLLFLIKQQLKLVKQGVKILLIDEL